MNPALFALVVILVVFAIVQCGQIVYKSFAHMAMLCYKKMLVSLVAM